MLNVIESDEAVIESQHGVVQADFVAQPLGQALNEPHHIVRKIADRAGHQRRKSRDAHGLKAFDAFPQERNWIALFPYDAIGAFHYARARVVAKNSLGMRAGKGVAGDFFAALDAFEQKGIRSEEHTSELQSHHDI